jgi:hypothetical protein
LERNRYTDIGIRKIDRICSALKLRITLEELKRPTLPELMAENAENEKDSTAPPYRTTSKFENPEAAAEFGKILDREIEKIVKTRRH